MTDLDREELIAIIVRAVDDLAPAFDRDKARNGKPAHGVRMACERLFDIASILGVHHDVCQRMSAASKRLY